MKGVPQWIVDGLIEERFICPKCKSKFSVRAVNAIGIRMSNRQPGQQVLYIEYRCKQCNQTTFIEMQQMTPMDFAMCILEELDENIANVVQQELSNNPPYEQENTNQPKIEAETIEPHKPKRKNKSKITLKEVAEAVKALKKISTHDEFLQTLGMLPDEIKKFNLPIKKGHKKDGPCEK